MSYKTPDDLVFRKSTHSNPGECVEVAPLPCGGQAVRDSKRPTALIQRFPAAEWSKFLDTIKSGEFDV
ncbi:hypothetical protein HNR23_002463 [Nocardiopsis mwathae]|uniref:DUF397 domain-containing protein n=1 Tax=Nocardiopsis mwathae TaxID=1472723 RepID=A0A7W9YHS7_9ACTN|nr:DUF397 domain-containing protein [Nocardiopsis mwathae]MBB6172403.1 hypothetical protein [Nocardiopsis mwathae]